MKLQTRRIATSSIALALAMALGTVWSPAREFTQKEGGKKLTGDIVGVDTDKGTVTMKLNGTRTVTFKQDLLVEEDVEFIREWASKNALVGRVSMSATRVAGERGSTKSGEIYEYRTEEAGFRITVRNTATSGTIPEIPINWKMVVTRSNGSTEVVSGSETIEYLPAGTSRDITTSLVSLQTSCKSLSSCPKCVSHAKEFTGDRLEGILVSLTNSDDETIQELVSPDMRERKIREGIGQKTTAAN